MKERRKEIRKFIEAEGDVSLVQLCAKFPSWSEMTIRRDLEYLENEHVLIRTKGGARLLSGSYGLSEDIYSERESKNYSLKQEIASLSGKKLELLPEVTVGIDFVSFALKNDTPGTLCCSIPESYIPSSRLRFDTYRRLGNLQSEAALDDFELELRDRYGKIPAVTGNLLKVTRLRILAALADYRQLSVINGRVTLNNPGGTIYRLPDGNAPRIDYRDSLELRLRHLTEILRKAAGKR